MDIGDTAGECTTSNPSDWYIDAALQRAAMDMGMSTYNDCTNISTTTKLEDELFPQIDQCSETSYDDSYTAASAIYVDRPVAASPPAVDEGSVLCVEHSVQEEANEQ